MSGADGVTAELKRLLLCLEAREDVPRSLEVLNTLFATNLSPAQVSSILSSLPLLFSFLQTEDSSQVQVTCAVLDKLLCCLPGSELVKYAPYIELGLQYSKAQLARTCLRALHHHSCEEDVREMIAAPTMVHLIAQTLAGSDIECATLSNKIFLKVFSCPGVLEESQDVLLEELKVLLLLDSVVRLRVYDLCVQLCVEGGLENCHIVSSVELLARLVGELEADDILLKMNVIELLSTLAESKRGVVYLQSSDVLKKLHLMLQGSREDALGVVLVPGERD